MHRFGGLSKTFLTADEAGYEPQPRRAEYDHAAVFARSRHPGAAYLLHFQPGAAISRWKKELADE